MISICLLFLFGVSVGIVFTRFRTGKLVPVRKDINDLQADMTGMLREVTKCQEITLGLCEEMRERMKTCENMASSCVFTLRSFISKYEDACTKANDSTKD